jgi:formylglycine-generating enzyme required for sulfatase activity
VEQVSWGDCQEFLKKLNALGKERGEFRLPTEAQWEYACRAGTKTRYCSGDAAAGLADYAWFDANSGGTTHPVGTRKPNAWGLHDMHGNVVEWCADLYGKHYYAESPRDDPTGPTAVSGRVFRGGSWYGSPRDCRSADRDGGHPAGGGDTVGFRVVVAPAGH